MRSGAVLEPLIEAARPRGKTPPVDLRRTIEAIFWRHTNGAKWRSVPAEHGPWWRAAQLFIRWSQLGAWERLLRLEQERGVALGLAFLDGTTVRAHQKSNGRVQKGDRRTSEIAVKQLAEAVAAMAPRLASSPTGAGEPSPLP